MNNPEDIKMGFDAGFSNAGFNPKIQPNVNDVKVDKKASGLKPVENQKIDNLNKLNLDNKVDIKFNTAKSANEVKNVNFFNDSKTESIGKTTFKPLASLDVAKGGVEEVAKQIYAMALKAASNPEVK